MYFAIVDRYRLCKGTVQPKTRRLIMISGIGSYNSYMNCMQTERARPDPADMFNKVDSDGSGGISQSELETLVENISDKTGNSIDTTDALSTYDTDGDGELSMDELKSFMDASGMAPPPPPPKGEGMANGLEATGGSSTTSAESILSAYDSDGDGMLNSDELQGFLDNGDTSSITKLIEQAISAYMTNFGNNQSSNMESAFLNFGGLNGYSSVDFSV
jgi:Ca2+-binding EF-hand superfamily protein